MPYEYLWAYGPIAESELWDSVGAEAIWGRSLQHNSGFKSTLDLGNPSCLSHPEYTSLRVAATYPLLLSDLIGP